MIKRSEQKINKRQKVRDKEMKRNKGQEGRDQWLVVKRQLTERTGWKGIRKREGHVCKVKKGKVMLKEVVADKAWEGRNLQ